jgi:hypothetical protein
VPAPVVPFDGTSTGESTGGIGGDVSPGDRGRKDAGHAGNQFTLVDVVSSFNFDAIPAKSRRDVSRRLNHHSPHSC